MGKRRTEIEDGDVWDGWEPTAGMPSPRGGLAQPAGCKGQLKAAGCKERLTMNGGWQGTKVGRAVTGELARDT
jgi:hypothetical protein